MAHAKKLSPLVLLQKEILQTVSCLRLSGGKREQKRKNGNSVSKTKNTEMTHTKSTPAFGYKKQSGKNPNII